MIIAELKKGEIVARWRGRIVCYSTIGESEIQDYGVLHLVRSKDGFLFPATLCGGRVTEYVAIPRGDRDTRHWDLRRPLCEQCSPLIEADRLYAEMPAVNNDWDGMIEHWRIRSGQVDIWKEKAEQAAEIGLTLKHENMELAIGLGGAEAAAAKYRELYEGTFAYKFKSMMEYFL